MVDPIAPTSVRPSSVTADPGDIDAFSHVMSATTRQYRDLEDLNSQGNNLTITGIAGTGAGITCLGGHPSFQMGSMARGVAGVGMIGGVDRNVAMASRGGPALIGGRNVRKENDSEAEGEQTWLEQDQDVWGTSGTRVHGMIR